MALTTRHIWIVSLIFTFTIVDRVAGQTCSGGPTLCNCLDQGVNSVSTCTDANNLCINCCNQAGEEMSNFYCNNSLFSDLASFFLGSSNLNCQCSYNPPVQSTPTVSSAPVATATPSSGSEDNVQLGIMLFLGTMVALIAWGYNYGAILMRRCLNNSYDCHQTNYDFRLLGTHVKNGFKALPNSVTYFHLFLSSNLTYTNMNRMVKSNCTRVESGTTYGANVCGPRPCRPPLFFFLVADQMGFFPVNTPY